MNTSTAPGGVHTAIDHTHDSPTPTTAGIARAFYEAMTADDVERARRLATADVVLHVPGGHALAGTHVGFDALLGFVAGSRALTDDGEHVEVIDILGGDQHAAAYCRITATRAGRRPLDNRTLHLLRVRSGRIAEIWLHNWDDSAVNEFWS